MDEHEYRLLLWRERVSARVWLSRLVDQVYLDTGLDPIGRPQWSDEGWKRPEAPVP